MPISIKRIGPIIVLLTLVLAAGSGLAYFYRLSLIIWLLVTTSPGTVLETVPDPEPGVEWYDDWFTIERIDDRTIAIGEPRYWQKNYNYLILGEERALLFDSGGGSRNIKPVVDSLTKLPVTVACSHLHYDHTGNHTKFESIALLDVPSVRARTDGASFTPTAEQFLGDLEGYPLPTFEVGEFWSHEQELDLGGRTLTVLHTPGHTPESMMLFDRERNQLLTGDMVYPGQLFAMLATSSMPDYLTSMKMLMEKTADGTLLLGAHADPDGPNAVPRMGREDLSDLNDALVAIKWGDLRPRGFYPKEYRVNDRMTLIADFPREQGW